MFRFITLLSLTIILASCKQETDLALSQQETELHLKHIETFFVDAWARSLAIHPYTGDILTIHDHRIVTGDVLKIQQHTKEGEFVKTVVDFEHIEDARYGLYYPKDMILDGSNRIHVLVYPVIELPDEEYDDVINQQLSILSFDLDGHLLEEYYFTVDSQLNNPAKIATSGNFLYATNGEVIWELNLSDDQLDHFPVRHLLPSDIGRIQDVQCDRQGRILFSYRVKNETDSVRSAIYRYDKNTQEFPKVFESRGYQHIPDGCCYTPSMFFDEDGLLYIVTSYVGSLEILTQELGNIFSIAEPTTGDLGSPAWDVAASDDYVFILGFMEVHVFHWE